jgi:hypothetical protein
LPRGVAGDGRTGSAMSRSQRPARADSTAHAATLPIPRIVDAVSRVVADHLGMIYAFVVVAIGLWVAVRRS